MTMERILGFFFLFLGVGVIAFALFSSLQVFTAKTAPPQIFSALDQQETALSQQLKSFIPSDTIPKILNLSVWSMFLGLLIFGGGQIAGIGAKLLKR